MNKNNVITILLAATLLGSTWGAVVNRQKIDLEQQLAVARAELRKVGTGTSHGQIKAGATGARDGVAEKEGQMIKPSQELTALRGQIQGLEANLAGCNATLRELSGKEGVQGAAAGGGLRQELDEIRAQLLGLEKIIDEKNAALQTAAQEKERLQINTEVLLAKIGEQQRELRSSQEENRQLVKELAAGREKAGPLQAITPPTPE